MPLNLQRWFYTLRLRLRSIEFTWRAALSEADRGVLRVTERACVPVGDDHGWQAEGVGDRLDD